MKINFIDLNSQRERLGESLEASILDAVRSGAFIGGPPVKEFNAKLAEFGKATHAMGCANGTDALQLPLMAWKVGWGDAVFCPSFTFCATGEVAPLVGATPVFVDIDPLTYNMCPKSLEAAIESTLAAGKFVPKVIIAVDLFGQPANYPALKPIADKYGLKLIADSAQGFGCTLHDKHPLHWADITATSFYPAKPLGCYGDGGAMLTDDAALAEILESVSVHGKAMPSDIAGVNFDHDPRYMNMRWGLNSRLDTIQAAVLLHKLTIFDDEIDARNRVAARYNAKLKDHVAQVPHVIEGGISTWAQYVIEHEDRDGLRAHLGAAGVPTAVYYPAPMHVCPAYDSFPIGAGGLAVTEAKMSRVLALPMHPYLSEAEQDFIVDAVARFGQ